MGKEIKIGLVVIAVLLCVFTVVLFIQLNNPDGSSSGKPNRSSKQTAKAGSTSSKQSRNTGNSKRTTTAGKTAKAATRRVSNPAPKVAKRDGRASLDSGYLPADSAAAASRRYDRYEKSGSRALVVPARSDETDDSEFVVESDEDLEGGGGADDDWYDDDTSQAASDDLGSDLASDEQATDDTDNQEYGDEQEYGDDEFDAGTEPDEIPDADDISGAEVADDDADMSDTSDSDFETESDPVPSSAWQRGDSSHVNPFDARRGSGTAAQRTKAADKRGSRLTLDGNFKQVPARTLAGEQGRYAGPADEMSGEEESSGASRAQPKKRGLLGGRVQGAERTASRTRGFGSERVYEVREGDTLFDIAREELGAAERWSDIYDLNTRELSNDVTYLEPGTQLVLPDIETAADATTQRRRRTFER